MKHLLLFCLIPLSAWAQYAPLELPPTWTFSEPTPAYVPDAPQTVKGDFQPGITVNVDGVDPATGLWRVIFKRYGSPDIISLVDAPNLAKAEPDNFTRVRPIIESFPLLQKMLEARTPWPESPKELGERLFSGMGGYRLEAGNDDAPRRLSAVAPEESTAMWQLWPLSVVVDYGRADSPQVQIELWNKGDAFKSKLDPKEAKRVLEQNLEKLQEHFRTTLADPGADLSSGITALRTKETAYLLPNDLRVSIRYEPGEYLLLVLQSVRALQNFQPPTYDPATFHQRLLSKVATSPNGHRYVKDIPMINQGEKGYCAAATLARVLQFYGYPVDQHAMAELAQTEAQFSQTARGGTLRENILNAMSRICGSTPFRLREVSKEHPDAISEHIEVGIPIIWLVPGHMRLLIGLHPETNEIVYSDSWGMEHRYKTASWDYFVNMNEEMWVLEPR